MSQPLTYPAPPAPAPQRRSSTGKIAGIVFAAVVVLGGIATAALFLLAQPVLDGSKVQAEIVRVTRDASGLEPTNVVCPPNVPVKAGAVTTCTAQLDGQPITYSVRQDDDKGNVHIQSAPFIVVDKVEKSLAERVGQNTEAQFSTDCANGKQIVVGGKGTTFACTVTNNADPADTADVTATITDDEGSFDFS